MPDWAHEEFMTVAEVAGLLKLNQQTIRNWIDAGRLPAPRIGRRVRILRSDLQRLIDSSQPTADHSASARSGDGDAFWSGMWVP